MGAGDKYAKLFDEYLPTLAEHEGRIAYMYLDSLGHLTVGIGHLMVRADADWTEATVRTAVAQVFTYGFTTGFAPVTRSAGLQNRAQSGALPRPWGCLRNDWMQSRDFDFMSVPLRMHFNAMPGVFGLPPLAALEFAPTTQAGPTLDAVTEDAVRIMKLPHTYKKKSGKNGTYGASHYRTSNRYAMTESGITRLAYDDVVKKIGELGGEKPFKNFDSFPQAAQIGLLDIAYQYGAHGAANHTKFSAAVQGMDWTAAAANVPSGVASETRTTWRKNQFKAAAPPPSR